jgi:hypothetical protein
MTQPQLDTLINDLVSQQGIESVITAIAQSAVTQAEGMSAMGHEPQAQEMISIGEALVGILAVTQES